MIDNHFEEVDAETFYTPEEEETPEAAEEELDPTDVGYEPETLELYNVLVYPTRSHAQSKKQPTGLVFSGVGRIVTRGRRGALQILTEEERFLWVNP